MKLGFAGSIAKLTGAYFVLVLVAVLTYSALARSIVDRQWVSHTLLVLRKLSDLQSQLADAETGQRGFLLTGEQRFLDLYEHAFRDIPGNMRDLRQLTADHPAQVRNPGVSGRSRIVHTLVAHVWASSEPGLGSAFYFTLAERAPKRAKAIAHGVTRV